MLLRMPLTATTTRVKEQGQLGAGSRCHNHHHIFERVLVKRQLRFKFKYLLLQWKQACTIKLRQLNPREENYL